MAFGGRDYRLGDDTFDAASLENESSEFMSGCRAGLIGFGLMLFATCVQAASCGVDGSESTQVRVGGRLISASAYFEDCRLLEVVRGPVRVCHVDRLLRRTCKSMNSGEHFAPDEVAAEQSSGLLALFQALPIKRAGGSRGGAGNLPSGLILPHGGDLVFSLGAGAGHASVIDAETKKTIAASQEGTTSLTIPRALLKQGRSYRWLMRSAMGVQQGDFSLPTRQQNGVILRALQQAQHSADARSDALASAIILWENGYEFDAQLVMD